MHDDDAITNRKNREQAEGAFIVEIDGKSASPSEIDTITLLEFASRYFYLVRCAANEVLSVPNRLTFVGLSVIDKCVGVRAIPSDIEVARDAAVMSGRWMDGSERPPTNVQSAVKEAQQAFQRFPEHQTGKILIGSWSQPIFSAKPVVAQLSSVMSIRAKLIKVGGRKPMAYFESRFEVDKFSLRVTEAHARDLGKHLYCEYNLIAKVVRDESGRIIDGKLLDGSEPIENLTPDETISAWKEFHRKVCFEWDEVPDPEAMLRHD